MEEPAADVGAIHDLRRAARREIEPLSRPGEGAVEQVGFPLLDLGPYRIRPRPVEKQRKAVRIAYGQGAQHQAVEDREQRCIGANSKCQYQSDDGSEARVPKALPDAISQVLSEFVGQEVPAHPCLLPRPLIAAVSPRVFQISE